MKTNRRFRSGTNKSGQHTHQMLRLLTAVLAMGMICACQKEESQDFTPPAPEPTAPLTLVPNTDPKVQNDIVLEEETPGVYKILEEGTRKAEEKARETIFKVRRALKINYFEDKKLQERQSKRFRKQHLDEENLKAYLAKQKKG